MIKPTSIYFRKFYKSSNHPDFVVPNDAPLVWKWGIRGYRVAKGYKNYIDSMDRVISEDVNAVANAKDELVAAKFSCNYGKSAKSPLRKIIKELEDKNKASREELRAMIYGGHILQKKDGYVKPIKTKWWLLLFDCYLIIGCTFLLVLYSIALLSSSEITWKSTSVYFAISAFSILSIRNRYWTGIKPYFVSRRLASDFNEIRTRIFNRKSKIENFHRKP